MTKKISTLCLLVFSLFSATAQKNYWQQDVEYTLNVSLQEHGYADPETQKTVDHVLKGFEEIRYTNNSPDTLKFIYFHLWMNAYKNENTAFAKQKLENGQLDFYNAKDNEKGKIILKSIMEAGFSLKVEYDTLNPDIAKIYLYHPLAPHDWCKISMFFVDYLPKTFSRGGREKSYQVSQWYPKPAVYDHLGWHPIPYLDQGEFYSEYGSYDVTITLPENYTVGATGDLQPDSKNESDRLNKLDQYTRSKFKLPANDQYPLQDISTIHLADNDSFPPSAPNMKTLHYKQDHVHDFAWFADKRFYVNQGPCEA